MPKHTHYDLKQMQSLPLETKIEMTKRRIKDWYDYWDGLVYVSFSGGKDSTVLKHIVDGMYDDIPSVFVNTGLEYPEIQQFVREIKAGKYDCFNPDVETLRPEMRFDEVIKKYGYPVISKEVSKRIKEARSKPDGTQAQYFKEGTPFSTKCGGRYSLVRHARLLDAPFKISSSCCDVMKKRPTKSYEKQTGRKAIVGTLAAESALRESAWLQDGCNAYQNNRPQSTPLSFWTEQDVLHYIKRYNVPYASVYGEIRVKGSKDQIKGQLNMIDYLGDYSPKDTLELTGCDRTGCVYCLFGCHREKEPNRIQRLKQTHPKQYEYCIGGGEYVDGLWQPNKEGLGIGKVMEFVGIPYK